MSPDLRAHPIPFFLEPVLSCHDPAQCRPIVYSDVARSDPVTRRLKQLAPAWRDVRPLSHAQLADLVRRDRVDVLVDLAGHTAEHRLLMFARVPAPVQVTYLGYPNTTGMPRSQMHYRLTDALADPPGIADTLHTEALVRLPDVFLCYRPPDDAPGVAPQPHVATGRATFGSFNTLEKVTAAQIGLWAQILRQVAGARMLLKNKSLGDAGVRDRVRAAFAAHGVGAERLVLAGPEPEPARHLARYHDVDVALDTFPYGGTTTTCEALWMGVPVVTLAGPTHRSRVGLTLLSAVGLSELTATTPQQYVDLAVTLAGEPARLRALRDSLRERVRLSPLTDARRFTENLESAYRQMWRAHCSRGATGAGAPELPTGRHHLFRSLRLCRDPR